MKLATRIGVLGVVALAGIGGAAWATGGASAAESGPPAIEETHDYPLADKILAEKGIRLLKGDGHILLVDCASAPASELIRVDSTAGGANAGTHCFRARGGKGYVTLELPEVFVIKAGTAHSIAAKIDDDGVEKAVAIAKNEWKPIAVDPSDDKGATLLEIRTTA